MKVKSQNQNTPDAAADQTGVDSDPEQEIEDVLSRVDPVELEDWDGSGVPAWVAAAALAAAPGVPAEDVCEFLRRKVAAGWQPRKWTAIPAVVRAQFTPKPKPNAKPWTGPDVSNLQKWLGAFMDGDEAPANLVSWIIDFSAEHSLQPSDIHRALDAAWKRRARPGQKNAPRTWNWFYEVLRAAFIPGYAARLDS